MISRKPGIFVLLVFISIITILASSGWSAFPETKFGFKAGGGLANIFGQDTFEQRWQESLAGGVFLDFNVWKKFHVEPEVIWFRKGSVYRLSLDQSEYREKLILDYLEFPVLIKFYLLDLPGRKIYLYGGPSVALNLRARLKVTFDGIEESVEVDNLKGTDYLMNAGAGTEIKLKSGFVIFELRYGHGLKSISTETEGDIRNKNLVVFVGYKF
jgi:hypothetical protein